MVELATGIAGPYAAKLLADYGADVVKVEPPQGDASRGLGVCIGDEPGPEDGPVHLHLNANKRSVVADIDDAAGRERIRTLVGEADIVIESAAPDVSAAHRLDHDSLRRLRPRLVTVSVTPFGLTGPYAGYAGAEIVHYAHGGPMNSAGLAKREPVKIESVAPVMEKSERAERELQMPLFHNMPSGDLPPLSLLDEARVTGKGYSPEALEALSRCWVDFRSSFGPRARLCLRLRRLAVLPRRSSSVVACSACDLCSVLLSLGAVDLAGAMYQPPTSPRA